MSSLDFCSDLITVSMFVLSWSSAKDRVSSKLSAFDRLTRNEAAHFEISSSDRIPYLTVSMIALNTSASTSVLLK